MHVVLRGVHDTSQHGTLSKSMAVCDFFDSKLVASVDGSVAAYRMPSLLAGGSVVLKQNSKYYEHFYADMKPGVHFLTFREDNSDLFSQVSSLPSLPIACFLVADSLREIPRLFYLVSSYSKYQSNTKLTS